jgi:coproporphyrinogen III oxidase-like Fe-S oxidoreductase
MSMGIQSFSEEILKKNNRPHILEDVYKAWDIIKKVRFTHNNIDLLYPLIGLDLPTFENSLTKAIELEPSCITSYPLEVWPETAYYNWLITKKTHVLPDTPIELDMCRLGYDMLEDAGFQRYSTSGYYHPERAAEYSRYLEYYWKTWPLIGFGVSSKTVIHDRLYTNIRSISDYVQRIEQGESIMDFGTRLSKEQEMRRVMIRGFKMCEVSKSGFLSRFGVSVETVFGREIEGLLESELIREEGDIISLTREGQVFSSNVWEEFFTKEDLRKPTEDEVEFGISELLS